MYELARRMTTPTLQFNFNRSMEVINTALDVLKKSVDELASSARSFATVSPAELAKIANNMSKTIDDIARLSSFMQGGPDSRPDLGLDAIFEHLSLEQVKTVELWLSESGAWQATLNQPSNEEKPN